MKKNTGRTIISYIVALLFGIFAILNFVNNNNSMGLIWMLLGSAFLSVGSVYMIIANKRNDESGKNKAD